MGPPWGEGRRSGLRSTTAARVAADPRRRVRLLAILLVAPLAGIFARLVSLERLEGEAFRQAAARPLVRREPLEGLRGRILARDGSVLAEDRRQPALAVMYRHLQNPPDETWLRREARRRLAGAARRDPRRVAEAIDALRGELAEQSRQLAALAGLSPAEWRTRAASIQRRVERIADSVARRRGGHPLTVVEEVSPHVVAAPLSLASVAEIEADPGRFPGARVVLIPRRHYPHGELAAHLVGHLGKAARREPPPPEGGQRDDASSAAQASVDPGRFDGPAPGGDAPVGQAGIERACEPVLRARGGWKLVRVQRDGTVVSDEVATAPVHGGDVVLTVDPRLQRAAEQLLDAALARGRAGASPDDPPAGGAIIVLDTASGEILAAASGPRFDPNHFVAAEAGQLEALLAHPARALLDRTVQMAIPPGSLFKVVAAIAALETGTAEADDSLYCRGYLHRPDRQRCLLFARWGRGHGEVDLRRALAQSCNVYFFELATRLGPEPLVHWAMQLGFGQPTGSDLPGEAAGTLPTPRSIRELTGEAWQVGHTQSLAVGQGALRATPLQVARALAVLAAGQLVVPHAVRRAGSIAADGRDWLDAHRGATAAPRRVEGLSLATREVLREALLGAVALPEGTAHATVFTDGLEIAGKTGTAEAGGGRTDHAWFAGLAPADAPQVVVVVALEHAGQGGAAAGPVAQRLFARLDELGYLARRAVVAVGHAAQHRQPVDGFNRLRERTDGTPE